MKQQPGAPRTIGVHSASPPSLGGMDGLFACETYSQNEASQGEGTEPPRTGPPPTLLKNLDRLDPPRPLSSTGPNSRDLERPAVIDSDPLRRPHGRFRRHRDQVGGLVADPSGHHTLAATAYRVDTARDICPGRPRLRHTAARIAYGGAGEDVAGVGQRQPHQASKADGGAAVHERPDGHQ